MNYKEIENKNFSVELLEIVDKSKDELGLIDVVGDINSIRGKEIRCEELRLTDLGKTFELTINSIKVIFRAKDIYKYNPLEPKYVAKIIATIYLDEYNKGKLKIDSSSLEMLKSKIE